MEGVRHLFPSRTYKARKMHAYSLDDKFHKNSGFIFTAGFTNYRAKNIKMLLSAREKTKQLYPHLVILISLVGKSRYECFDLLTIVSL